MCARRSRWFVWRVASILFRWPPCICCFTWAMKCAIACWEVGLFGVNPSLTLVMHGESFEIFFWFDIALTRPCWRSLWWGIAISTPRNLFVNAVFDSVLSNALLWEFLVRFFRLLIYQEHPLILFQDSPSNWQYHLILPPQTIIFRVMSSNKFQGTSPRFFF